MFLGLLECTSRKISEITQMYGTFGCKRCSSSTSFGNFILATLPVTPIKIFFSDLFLLFGGGPSSSAILDRYYYYGNC